MDFLPMRLYGSCSGIRCRRKGVDHLARPGIAQLLAGFTLNRPGVCLEGFDLLRNARVLRLKIDDLLLQLSGFVTLVEIADHAILSEGNMKAEHQAQGSD